MSTAIRTSTFLEALFGESDGLLELRLKEPEGRIRQHFVALHDLDAIKQIVRASNDVNVWFGVAPRTTEDGSINGCGPLTTLFADLDFATSSEDIIRTALDVFPLPPSILVHSGGGLHCYHLLREPLDLPGEKDRAKSLLKRLAQGLGGDSASAEPARVLRLPNTQNVKYDPSRPVTIEICDPERRYNLSEIEDWLPEESRPAPLTAVNGTIPKGRRHRTMVSNAGALRRRGLDEPAIRAALEIDNTARFDPPLPLEEVTRIARDIAQKPPAEGPRHGETERRLVLTPLSRITARPVRFLWKDRLAVGSFALLGGREGIGKTIVASTLAADLTRGRLPGLYEGSPKGVIIAATEDAWEFTIKPRFMAAGADQDRVFRVDVELKDGVADWLSVPRDLEALAARIAEVDAALVILDPLSLVSMPTSTATRMPRFDKPWSRSPAWPTGAGRMCWASFTSTSRRRWTRSVC